MSSSRVKHGPPSPPLSEGRELQQGFNSLMQHNAATQYHQGPYALDHGTYFQSSSNTTFSSPESSHVVVDAYGRSQYQVGYSNQQDLGFGYGSPAYYLATGSDYLNHPPPQQSVSQRLDFSRPMPLFIVHLKPPIFLILPTIKGRCLLSLFIYNPHSFCVFMLSQSPLSPIEAYISSC